LLKLASPRFLICHFDPRRKHGADQLNGYRNLCEQSGAQCVLEVVVESVDDYAQELRELALAVKQSGLGLAAIAVCPVGDLKSVLPSGARPPAPPVPDLYRRERDMCPHINTGGVIISFFPVLKRK